MKDSTADKIVYGALGVAVGIGAGIAIAVLTMMPPPRYDFVSVENGKLWVLDYNQTEEDCIKHLREYNLAPGYHCIPSELPGRAL